MSAHQVTATEQKATERTRCILRRRQPKVVVRAPDATPCSVPRAGHERRRRVSTLVGLGAREAMPTLFDIDTVEDEPTSPRVTQVHTIVEADTDTNLAIVEWDDDDDATCFDV